ncbi:hypothetical protein ACFQU7_27575 [Pseudoroseomonas wenyumeiae]
MPQVMEAGWTFPAFDLRPATAAAAAWVEPAIREAEAVRASLRAAVG